MFFVTEYVHAVPTKFLDVIEHLLLALIGRLSTWHLEAFNAKLRGVQKVRPRGQRERTWAPG